MRKLFIFCILAVPTSAFGELSAYREAVSTLNGRVAALGQAASLHNTEDANERVALEEISRSAVQSESKLNDVYSALAFDRSKYKALRLFNEAQSSISSLTSRANSMDQSRYMRLHTLANSVTNASSWVSSVFSRPEPPQWIRNYSTTLRKYSESESYAATQQSLAATMTRDERECQHFGAVFLESQSDIVCEQKTICVRGLFRCREWRTVFDCTGSARSSCME